MRAPARKPWRKAQTLPALAILDVHLPDFSGFELCQESKEIPRTAHIPSSRSRLRSFLAKIKPSALEAGADGYLTQPIDGVGVDGHRSLSAALADGGGCGPEAAVQWQSTFDALSEGLAWLTKRQTRPL